MKLDDILFCLMDMADDYKYTDDYAQEFFLPHDLEMRLFLRKLHEQYDKKVAAIKEIVTLLRMIQRYETVELNTDPDGLYYEATDAYGARIGTIMNGEDTKNG